MNNYIYLKGLKRAEHTVFCVENGQKTYYDVQFGKMLPYSSGQQVKRSIVDYLLYNLNIQPAPTTFNFDVDKNKKLKEGEAWSTCDPLFPDQLLSGWMRAEKGGGHRTIKRRSPLSISAMRPLHPLLCGVSGENISFDKTHTAHINKVNVRDSNDRLLSDEEIAELLKDTDRSLNRKWVPDTGGSNSRATGLFTYDIAIDLRRLFCVSTNILEPEVYPETIEKLKADGWIETKNVFGECLLAPKATREKIIPALAKSLINWRITSNQSRTFSLMETLAVALSENASFPGGAIRAKLLEESEKQKAKPIIDNIAGVDLFVTLACAGYIITNNETIDALEKAEEKLIEMLFAFDYENQLSAIEESI